MDVVAQLKSALEGRYEVDREIGAGGMATVYLARDVRHDRKVALKLLKPELGAVLGVERFLSEIRVTANLQHTNLLPLFDSGEANGLLYYVMPFVEGESLRAKLDREKQLPVDEAVRISVAIASALAYAHDHGVIHRDLKPENVLLQAGQPVIADFGIALAVTKAGGNRITQTGLSLGTPQYMSPEQATGDRTIDGRSDIYSLAVMTYEMLTGDPPYVGSTAQAIIARVLTEKPRAVRMARSSVPVHVDETLERALEKLPADRFATATEFADALQGRAVATLTRGVASAATVPRRRSTTAWRITAVASAAAALVATGWLLGRQGTRQEPAVVRLTMTLPDDAPMASGTYLGPPISVSGDARTIAYTAQGAAGAQIAVRRLDDLHAQLLPGTTGGVYPVVSNDGKRVAVFHGGTVKQVEVDGSLSDATPSQVNAGTGGSWTSTGVLVLGNPNPANRGLGVLSAPRDSVRVLATPDSAGRHLTYNFPVVLNDDDHVLFAGRLPGPLEWEIGVVSLTDRRVHMLALRGIPLGVVENTLVYVVRNGSVMGVRFDVNRAAVEGEPIVLEQGVRVHANGSVEAALARDGTLVYATGSLTSKLMSVDLGGVARPLFAEAGQFASPRYSPDGLRIAVNRASGTASDIWIYDVRSKVPRRLTSEGSQNDRPEWTPDGAKVLYRGSLRGVNQYFWRSASSIDTMVALIERPAASDALIAPDMKTVLFRTQQPGSGMDILARAIADGPGGPTRNVVVTNFDEMMPTLSRDGRWLAYVSNFNGPLDVFVQALDGSTERVPVSVGGGNEPRWSPDMRTIYYRANRRIIAATVVTAPTLAVTARDTLFDDRYEHDPFRANWDIAPNGREFVVLEPVDNNQQIVVVLNWARVVREKMSAARKN